MEFVCAKCGLNTRHEESVEIDGVLVCRECADNDCTEACNKYGVPYHQYVLTLDGGDEIVMDVGVEEDWGNVQRCVLFPDVKECAGWGDEENWDGIISVIDFSTGEKLDPMEWAVDRVWKYAENYSS